jgi:hypothetical protein
MLMSKKKVVARDNWEEGNSWENRESLSIHGWELRAPFLVNTFVKDMIS